MLGGLLPWLASLLDPGTSIEDIVVSIRPSAFQQMKSMEVKKYIYIYYISL